MFNPNEEISLSAKEIEEMERDLHLAITQASHCELAFAKGASKSGFAAIGAAAMLVEFAAKRAEAPVDLIMLQLLGWITFSQPLGGTRLGIKKIIAANRKAAGERK